MTSEKAIWQWLKNANQDPGVFLYRVENSAGSGMPDVQGYIEGYGNIFIELKDGVYPARQSTLLKFDVRSSQEFWHLRMSRLGSTSHFFLIQIERDRFLIPGKFAKVLREGVSLEWLSVYKMPNRVTALEYFTQVFRRFAE